MLHASLVNYLQLVVVALWYLWWEVDDMFSRCGRQLLISVNPDPLIVQSACRRSLGCVTILPCFNPNIMVSISSNLATMHQVFVLFTRRRKTVLLEQAWICEMCLINKVVVAKCFSF